MMTMDDYATMGLDAMTVGAESAESQIEHLDNAIHAHDGMIYKWGIGIYGPAGVLGQKPDDTNTVLQEQTYFKGWGGFLDEWSEFETKASKALLEGQGFGGGGAISDELAKGISREVDKKKAAFDSWVARFDLVKTGHDKKKNLPTLAPPDVAGIFPWGKVLLAAAAVGVVGTLFYLRKQADEAELASKTPPPRPLLPSDDDGPDTVLGPPRGMSLSPPSPLPSMRVG